MFLICGPPSAVLHCTQTAAHYYDTSLHKCHDSVLQFRCSLAVYIHVSVIIVCCSLVVCVQCSTAEEGPQVRNVLFHILP